MGQEFVLALDKQFDYDEIWVIARRKERLEELVSQVKAKIVPIALDLSQDESYIALSDMLAKSKQTVKTLVNAAGFGRFRHFDKTPLNVQTSMVDVNCKALMAITYVVLPYIAEGGEIYEMGSMSSFQPVPCITLYGATKAFVLSFSRALGFELRPRNIKVMCVCPGWIKTEFFSHAIEDDTVNYFNRYYEPKQVIDKALKDMAKGKTVSILGFPERMQSRLVKLLPANNVMKIWCKQQKINIAKPKQ